MKRLYLVGILGLMGLNFYVYWSVHLYYKGKNMSNPDEKISLLDKSQRMNPLNDKVYYEKGKVYFERSVKEVGEPEIRDENLNRAVEEFIQAVRLNPGSYAAHFRLAQTLSYKNYFQPVDIDYYEQYKKAALLTTFDEEIYFEIGRILLQNWGDLSQEDKKYAAEMMKNIIGVKKKQGLREVIQVWATYVEDYSIMNEILPEEPEAYRIYAEFLGGRSLSLSERLDKLARAESMEYKTAKSLYNRGLRQARIYHMKNAQGHLSTSLRQLEGIKFYQVLVGEKWIDEQEYLNTLQSVNLGLAKLKIQRTGALKEAEGHLKAYLEMEGEEAEIEELEKFLLERDFLEIKPGISESFFRLYLKLTLDFNQHRYREVVKEREKVEDLFFSVSSNTRKDLVKILQMVGDSYQKIDFIYDAGELYEIALELDPFDFGTLIRMRENYIRLNDQAKIKEIDQKLSQVLMPQEMVFDNKEIQKGKIFSIPLIFMEESIVPVDIEISQEPVIPLVAVFLNGRVIDEQYVRDGQISGLVLDAEKGENILEIKPINRDIEVIKIRNKAHH